MTGCQIGVLKVPTYTYQCKKCGHAFDLFHAISAQPHVECPECQGECTRLIGTGAGIIFKGSGFYQTDYKKGGFTGSSSSDSASTAKAGAKSESKSSGNQSDSKSAASGE